MQEKYLRMHACKNILLEIPSFKSVNFQKNTSVLHRYQRKTENSASHCKVCCKENQETSQWLLSRTFSGWFNHQMKSRLLVHENFKEERTYCTISRLKLFMYKLCKLRFFFWSNIEISFTFYNNSRTCFESRG